MTTTTLNEAQRTLNILCSAAQYLHDRGELSPDVDTIVTSVRYKAFEPIHHFDIVVNGQLVRITAEVIDDR